MSEKRSLIDKLIGDLLSMPEAKNIPRGHDLTKSERSEIHKRVRAGRAAAESRQRLKNTADEFQKARVVIADDLKTTAGNTKEVFNRYFHNAWSEYQVGEKLGSGVFGSVYAAVEKATGEPVAIKVFFDRVLEGRDIDLEPILALRVNGGLFNMVSRGEITDFRSRGLITVRGGGHSEQGRFIVYPRMDGTLYDLVKKNPTWFRSNANLARMVSDLYTAVASLHKFGFAHNDLHQKNIFYKVSGGASFWPFGVPQTRFYVGDYGMLCTDKKITAELSKQCKPHLNDYFDRNPEHRPADLSEYGPEEKLQVSKEYDVIDLNYSLRWAVKKSIGFERYNRIDPFILETINETLPAWSSAESWFTDMAYELKQKYQIT